MKRTPFFIVVIAFTVGICAFLWIPQDSELYKINKSLQIFGEIFRQVQTNYVEDVPADELVRSGIDAMLNWLDPYTDYYEETEQDEIDIVTNGVYGGLGITVGSIDSTLRIIGLAEGFAAEKAGVHIGDRIIKVDSAIVDKVSQSTLHRFTRGQVGTKVVLTVLRGEFQKDTLTIPIIRQEITIKNVAVAEYLPGDVGYIKLERFSRSAASEVRSAIAELKKNREPRGLILDVRDNPGGLLDAAVSISEIFVPSGSLVVSTRGKNSSEERKYYSRTAPTEPHIPLSVLINGGSASASEILAGAIQDYDRGVLIGERSFGKGLVQTIVPLPFNGNLKMTTARYYTPSGRCIQKIDYGKRRKGIAQTSVIKGENGSETDSGRVFYTASKRLVREQNGISPDSVVREVPESEFVNALQKKHMFFYFANEFAARKDSLPTNFAVNKLLLKQFSDFLVKMKFTPKGGALEKLFDVETQVRKENPDPALLQKIDKVEQTLLAEQNKEFDKHSSAISRLLEREILIRYLPRSKFLKRVIPNDNQVLSAARLVTNSAAYSALIGVESSRH